MDTKQYMEYAYNILHPEIQEEVLKLQKNLFDLPLHQLVGGKHFRPILVMLCCQACGGRISNAITPAQSMEFLHQSSLIHDDILDEDRTRRGEEATHVSFGIKEAVLIGDAAFTQAAKLLISLSKKEILIGMDAGFKMFKGAVQEALIQGLKDHPYKQIIKLKTASLFASSAQLGAISADAPPNWEEACRVYGKNLGMAYQITDDLVDILVSVKTGTPTGDLKEFRPTYPLFCMYMANPELKSLFGKFCAGTSKFDDLAAAISRDKSGVKKCQKDIEEYIAHAIKAISILPASVYRGLLEDIPLLMIEAMAKELES